MEATSGLNEAFDLLGRRWALRVVWEVRRDSLAFAELRTRLGISPSVLSSRLRELEEAGVLDRDPVRRYRLTAHGRELARLLYELNRWASGPRTVDPDDPAEGQDRGVSSQA